MRAPWLGGLLFLVLPSLSWANGSYLVGSIGLAEVSVGELGSAAEIECYDFWGNLADICRFGGTHHIANDTTGHLIAHEPFEAFGSSWINFLRGIGGGGRCFRARVNGVISGSTYSQAWGFAEGMPNGSAGEASNNRQSFTHRPGRQWFPSHRTVQPGHLRCRR